MRFGINTLQRETLFPPGLSPSEALGHLASIDHAELARTLHGHGFNPIELSGDMAMFLPHTMSPQTVERLLRLKEETTLSYTVHLPLWSVEPSTPLAPVRLGSQAALTEAIAAARPLDPEVYVLHATGPLAAEFFRMELPDLAKDYTLRVFQDHAKQSLEAILLETGLSSRKLAIETVEFPFDLTLALAEALDLSICLDTGHVLVGFSGPVDIFYALNCCLPRLAEIHLHDGPWQGPQREIGYGKDHQPLGHGDLDVGQLLERLKEAGFSGPMIFELTVTQALESLAFIQTLLPEVLP